MTHNRDIVPEWPPVWVGFHHVPTEVWVIDVSLAHVSVCCWLRLYMCCAAGNDCMRHDICF